MSKAGYKIGQPGSCLAIWHKHDIAASPNQPAAKTLIGALKTKFPLHSEGNMVFLSAKNPTKGGKHLEDKYRFYKIGKRYNTKSIVNSLKQLFL